MWGQKGASERIACSSHESSGQSRIFEMLEVRDLALEITQRRSRSRASEYLIRSFIRRQRAFIRRQRATPKADLPATSMHFSARRCGRSDRLSSTNSGA